MGVNGTIQDRLQAMASNKSEDYDTFVCNKFVETLQQIKDYAAGKSLGFLKP